MVNNMMKSTVQSTIQKAILLSLPLILCACGTPQEEFEGFINRQGYIAYKTPLGSAGVGSIVKGQKDNLRLAANPQRCFPDKVSGKATQLRWQTDTTLPNEFKSINVGLDVDLSPLTSFANPLLGLNFGFGYAKNVSIVFDGASVEFLDELQFQKYYDTSMSDLCKQSLNADPFIVQSLKINKMTFSFKDSWGANVKLTPGVIGDMFNIGAGVEWEMKNDYELQIKTPKYIGYQLGKLDTSVPGYIGKYARKTDSKGNFIFESAKNDAAQVKASSTKIIYPAPPLSELNTTWGDSGSGESLD